ncbi:MAG: hypothetical protein FJ263_02830 [Planctomycetes bacterium]|nr:hypothetical protein [Planctomycetota bacterium]
MSKSKNNSISTSGNAPTQGQDSLVGLFARIFWSLIGNIILVFLAVKIFRNQALFSISDLLYWVLVSLLALTRYCDIKYLKGITAEGLPATMTHWRKYVKYLVFISTGLWLLAHIISFLKK